MNNYFKRNSELIFYISVCIGIAINSSSFTIVAAMFEAAALPVVILATILAGLICIVIADAVSELASKFPSSPGVRTYFKRAFPEKHSLFLVYLYMVFIILAGAVESSLFAHIFNRLFPSVNPLLLLIGMLTFTVISNLYGYVLPRVLQVLTTVIVIVILLFLGIYGIAGHGAGSPAQHLMQMQLSDLYTALPLAAGMAIFLYVGFEWVAPLGFSRESYKKLIPFSMPAGIAVNIVVYSVFAIGLAFMIPRDVVAKEILPQLLLADGVLPFFGKILIAVLAATCTISTFNAGLLGGSKLVYALARERKLPPTLVRVSMKTGQPYMAILLIGVTVCITGIATHLLHMELLLATAATSMMTIIYAAILFASNRLRGKKVSLSKEEYKPVFSGKIKIIIAVFLLLIGGLVIFSLPGQEISTLITFVCMVLLAFCFTGLYSAKANTPAELSKINQQ